MLSVSATWRVAYHILLLLLLPLLIIQSLGHARYSTMSSIASCGQLHLFIVLLEAEHVPAYMGAVHTSHPHVHQHAMTSQVSPGVLWRPGDHRESSGGRGQAQY